jgi:microcystin-dependent protein
MAQPYVGEIRMFGGNFAPAGWMLCQGQSLPISENEVLFQLVGTTYGGDGQETFNLPNLASRVPIHMGTGPGLSGHNIGEMAGVESVTLSTQQIPNHTHTPVGSGGAAATADPTSNIPATSQSQFYYNLLDNPSNFSPSAIGPAGGSQPHENMQPFLCINFIISLFGIFPSQT